jgi:hypothetical protein
LHHYKPNLSCSASNLAKAFLQLNCHHRLTSRVLQQNLDELPLRIENIRLDYKFLDFAKTILKNSDALFLEDHVRLIGGGILGS